MTDQEQPASNALGSLADRQKQRRKKTTRREEAMPPPRHPRAEPTESTEAQAPAASTEEPAKPLQSEEAAASSWAAAQPAPAVSLPTQGPVTVAPRATPATPPAASEARSDATRARRTPSIEVYLPDDELTDWINDVEDAGFARRQRAILSPVVRLALNRLRAEMTAEQVVAEVLRNAPPPTGRRGRPRL